MFVGDPDKIRPGTQRNTQTYRGSNRNIANLAAKNNLKTDQVQTARGLNEPWEWYDKCYTRERNKGKSIRVCLRYL